MRLSLTLVAALILTAAIPCERSNAQQKAAGNLGPQQSERAQRERQVQTQRARQLQQRSRSQRNTQNRNTRNQAGRGRVSPTHGNVHYGPYDRNVLDVWLAKSDAPTPVLVSIHGGGFRGGNKSVEAPLLRACLESGISVVAITYRLSGTDIAPAQHHDAARAIQFVRSKADEWNLDPDRMAATGGSAGAGLSLWLGFHADMADPDNPDPVLRHSTRLSCMAVYNGQTSYDPRFIRKLFPGTDTYKHPALPQLYGVQLDDLEKVPAAKLRLFEEISALPHLSKDDPPALLMYASRMDTRITSQGIGIHHPRFGQVLKEQMEPMEIECRVETGVRRGDAAFTDLTMSFIKRHLKVSQSESESD